MSGRETAARIAELRRRLDDASHRYHVLDDPTIAAIAAWRLGQLKPGNRPREAVAALLGRYLGVPGLARDAAAAALARQLRASPPAPAPVPPLPQVRARGWEITVERWLTAVIAPDYPRLDAAALQPFQAELREALAAAQTRSRAEAQAAQTLLHGAGCPAAPAEGAPPCLDLGPLVRPPEVPGGARADPGRTPGKPRAPR